MPTDLPLETLTPTDWRGFELIEEMRPDAAVVLLMNEVKAQIAKRHEAETQRDSAEKRPSWDTVHRAEECNYYWMTRAEQAEATLAQVRAAIDLVREGLDKRLPGDVLAWHCYQKIQSLMTSAPVDGTGGSQAALTPPAHAGTPETPEQP